MTCPLCNKERDLILHSPYNGIFTGKEKVRICKVCAEAWDNKKPFTYVLQKHLWKEPKDGLDAALNTLRMMNYMLRYAAEITANPESLAEHSYFVTVVAHQLASMLKKRGEEVNLEKVLTIALYHDIEEPFTGDIPTPLKSEDVKAEVEGLEKRARAFLAGAGFDYGFLDEYNKDNDLESRIVKCADFICAVVYVTEEYFVGSEKMGKVRERTMKKFKRWVKLDWEKELYERMLKWVDGVE